MGLSSVAQFAAADEEASAVRRLIDSPAGFHGPAGPTARADSSVADTGAITLGVIAPRQRLAGREMLAAVRLVVEATNAEGGVRGRQLRLAERTDDRPWHSAAHEVTSLILEDGAIAIVGGLDGARAHAAELVVAKLWVPLISPTAADRSVDVANVPWVFRCAPDEQRQMVALAGVACDEGWRRLRLVIDDEREGRLARVALEAAVEGLGIALEVVVQGVDTPPASAAATILWVRRETALGWLSRRSPDMTRQPLLLPLHLVAPDVLSAAAATPVWAVAMPSAAAADSAAGAWFVQAWRERFGTVPSSAALLTADATLILLASVERHGAEPARLRQALAQAHFTGLTGETRFDRLGGRLEIPEVTRFQQPSRD